MKTLLLVLSLTILSQFSNAQEKIKSKSEPFAIQAEALPNATENETTSQRYERLKNSFLIISNTNIATIISDELLDLVEENRQELTNIEITSEDGIKLLIYSKESIKTN